MKHIYYNQTYFTKRDHLDILIAATIRNILIENDCTKILDIGCGTGRLVQFLNDNDFKTIGIDSQNNAVKHAQQINKKGTIIKASATKLPVKNNVLDFVSCISTVEHLSANDGKKCIQEAYRVIKPGGFIFLITPNFSSPLRYLLGKKWFGYSDPTHIYFYTPLSLATLLQENGFYDIRFRFRPPYDVLPDWYASGIARKIPHFVKHFLMYLFVASPLATYRDSFWIMGKKR